MIQVVLIILINIYCKYFKMHIDSINLYKIAMFFFTDFVAVPVKIFVNGSVQVASSEYKFYNCAAAVRKAENTPYVSSLASFVSVCVPVLCWHQYVYNEYEYL